MTSTVDRRAVQDVVESIRSAADKINANAASGPSGFGSRENRKRIFDWSAEILDALAELPSSNPQAVAWQRRRMYSNVPGAKPQWEQCSRAEAENRSYRDFRPGYEYRALCVCSGDAKEA